jgi:hypothetical protein
VLEMELDVAFVTLEPAAEIRRPLMPFVTRSKAADY